MTQVQQCIEVINAYLAECVPTKTSPVRENPVRQAIGRWFGVVRCFEEAFSTCRQFNQVQHAAELVERFFQLLDTTDDFTSRLALRLLMTVVGQVDWLDRIQPGTQQQVKSKLARAISQELLYQVTTFWMLAQPADRQSNSHRSIVEFWRDLCDDEEERQMVDVRLVQMMDLAGHVALVYGNYDDAEAWSRHAAHIAQKRLGDSQLSATMLHRAEQMARRRAMRLVNPALVQALSTEAPFDPEYVAAMEQMDIRENLQVILIKGLQEQHRERFLPSLDEFAAEYTTDPNKLARLLTDSRLLIDNDAIETRVARYGNQGLASVIPATVKDQHGNIRGELSTEGRFIEQYIRESEKLVGGSFLIWQDSGDLIPAQIIDLAKTSRLMYDWRIFEEGIEHHFQRQYTCAVHMLIPQFENIARIWAQARGIRTKRIKDGIESEMLLYDLFNPDNASLKSTMNPGLFHLVHWYMVRSASSFNYRNKVAHGWITSEECNMGHLSAMTIWLTLKVITSE